MKLPDIYLELCIILLSIIVVLAVLIVYIVRQTLNQKRKYQIEVERKTTDKRLWIDADRRDSGPGNHLHQDLSLKIDENAEKEIEELSEEQMITFSKQDKNDSSENVETNLELHHHHHNHHHHNHDQHHESQSHAHYHLIQENGNVSPPLPPPPQTTTDANQYSEYCVPNC